MVHSRFWIFCRGRDFVSIYSNYNFVQFLRHISLGDKTAVVSKGSCLNFVVMSEDIEDGFKNSFKI